MRWHLIEEKETIHRHIGKKSIVKIVVRSRKLNNIYFVENNHMHTPH